MVRYGASLVLPARTASTTARIESMTSCGWSLWTSWPLSVSVMCVAPGTISASLAWRLLLRPVGDVTEVRGNIGRQQAVGDHFRDERSPWPVRGQHHQRHRLERRGSEKLVEAAVRIALLQVGIQLQALPYVAFHQDPLDRPLVTRLRFPESLRQGIDKNRFRPPRRDGCAHRAGRRGRHRNARTSTTGVAMPAAASNAWRSATEFWLRWSAGEPGQLRLGACPTGVPGRS